MGYDPAGNDAGADEMAAAVGPGGAGGEEEGDGQRPAKRARKVKPYLPNVGTANYAYLVVLYLVSGWCCGCRAVKVVLHVCCSGCSLIISDVLGCTPDQQHAAVRHCISR